MNHDAPTALILLGPSPLQIDWARTLNIGFVVVDRLEAYAGTSLERDKLIFEEHRLTTDMTGLLDEIRKRLDGGPMAALGLTERHLIASAALNHMLGTPDNSEEVVSSTVDKSVMRQLLAATPLGITFQVARDSRDVDDFFTRTALDSAVAKPLSGSGSSGVFRVSKTTVLAGELFPILLEEPLTGPEFSVEMISEAGEHFLLGITEQSKGDPGGPDEFVQVGHVFPSTSSKRAKIIDTVISLLNTLRIEEGLTHTEVIVTDRGVFPVETHTRNGGDRIVDMCRLARGVDMIGLAMRQRAGLSWRGHLAPTVSRFAAVRYITPPVGYVQHVSGAQVGRYLPGVVDLSLWALEGSLAAHEGSYADRVGEVLVVGESEAECKESLARALAVVQVDVTTEP